MAYIDYYRILSYEYAQLLPSARILIPVLSTLCDETGALTRENNKAAALGEYAGLARNAIRTGLVNLAAMGMISYQPCPGRSPFIQYRPAINSSDIAIIDYHAIRSRQYAQLLPSARILIPVLSILCDRWCGAITPENSKATTLGKYAGLGAKAVRAGLLGLDSAGVITSERQSGRPPSIQYLPPLHVARKNPSHLGHKDPPSLGKLGHKDPPPRSIRSTTSVIKIHDLGHKDPPQSPKKAPQTPAATGENADGKVLALNCLNSFKQEQQQDREPDPVLIPEVEPVENDIDVVVFDSIQEREEKKSKSAADKVSKTLIKQMTSKYGAEVVKIVLEGMKNFNGEIQNANAYFRTCVANGWTPTSKATRDREEKQARDAARFRREEEERREYDRKVKEFEESDPAMAQAAFDAINAM